MAWFYMDILKMSEGIFRISKNEIRAKTIRDLAVERFEDIKEETKTYKIIEQYYEIIKELVTSIMYADGFKTLSHKLLFEYLERIYKEFFDKEELILVDQLRKLRNDIMYYGKKIDSIYLKNKEAQIKRVIHKLMKLSSDKLR